MKLDEIKSSIAHHGGLKTFEDLALRAVNRLIFLKVLKCVKIDTVNPEYMTCHEKYRGMFLDMAALKEFSKDPEYELPQQFLEHALTRGHRCYGFLQGNSLAAYGWYASEPTDWGLLPRAQISCPDLLIHFDPSYVYMYKGFTHARHRGQRLHAIGMTRALDAYLAAGYKGIVSYVEWNNFASLKSCYRMGYSDVGNIYALRMFRRYLVHSDAACAQLGLKLEPAESLSSRALAPHRPR